MKIVITETKLRNIIRTELKNYLIQEGIGDVFSSMGAGLKNIGSTIKKDFSDTFKQSAQKSVFSSMTDKFGSKVPPQFSQIQSQIQFLLPEKLENIKTLYTLFFSENMQYNANDIKKIVQILNKLPEILKGKLKEQVSEYDIDPTTGAPVAKPATKRIAEFSNALTQITKNFENKSNMNENSSLIAANIVFNIIKFYELALGLPEIKDEVKSKLTELTQNVEKHLESKTTAPPATPAATT